MLFRFQFLGSNVLNFYKKNLCLVIRCPVKPKGWDLHGLKTNVVHVYKKIYISSVNASVEFHLHFYKCKSNYYLRNKFI
jgi:hypothetical protein